VKKEDCLMPSVDFAVTHVSETGVETAYGIAQGGIIKRVWDPHSRNITYTGIHFDNFDLSAEPIASGTSSVCR
jgi:hypothetical protein